MFIKIHRCSGGETGLNPRFEPVAGYAADVAVDQYDIGIQRAFSRVSAWFPCGVRIITHAHRVIYLLAETRELHGRIGTLDYYMCCS